MSLFTKRPRLAFPTLRPILHRGVRRARQSIGDAAGEWLKGPGLRYKYPTKGPNWLGEAYPFPMNPSFKPPPPISNKTKEYIYEWHRLDPKKYNVRALAGAYGISMNRVDAILRLKGMEKRWLEGRQLQTGFLEGMERMLNASELATGNVPGHRQDVSDADIQDQKEEDDHARDRYQRLFWEPLADGEEPVIPRELEKAKEEAKTARAEAVVAKSDTKLLAGREVKCGDKTLPREKTVIFQSGEDRPVIVFKDVGGRFLDVEDRIRRMHEADRRRQAKDKEEKRQSEH